ncbi:winged helix-turn-helix domain-containing protein [Demequina pelophila]|uniref:winged helix-turn-helix domain-containing protein n=1 Tax=Demequina pelophila TaxID=1638984 RepID=UPI00078407D5|nr:helix-turn-helix domain-containing protein [Demequina pelophila]
MNDGPASDAAQVDPEDRQVDPEALKALAHPLRVELFDRLAMYGPATASSLAKGLGETSGATSYHLRQLARHGFIEEDAGRGTARERWWRIAKGGLQLSAEHLEGDAAAREAGDLVTRQWLDLRARHADAFVRRGLAELGTPWVEASMLSTAPATLTAEELEEVNRELLSTLTALVDRYRDREAPEGARPVMFQVNGFPLVDAPGQA